MPALKLFNIVRTAAAGFGHDLEGISVGGDSDANFVAALGIPVLCGMGAVGDGAHARNEYIYPDAIPLYTAITAETLGISRRSCISLYWGYTSLRSTPLSEGNTNSSTTASAGGSWPRACSPVGRWVPPPQCHR